MASYNFASIDKVNFNGTAVKTVVFNGTTAWTEPVANRMKSVGWGYMTFYPPMAYAYHLPIPTLVWNTPLGYGITIAQGYNTTFVENGVTYYRIIHAGWYSGDILRGMYVSNYSSGSIEFFLLD